MRILTIGSCRVPSVAMILLTAVHWTGCSSGGGGGGSTGEAGIELPSEISAVSASDSGGAIRSGKAARESASRALAERNARIARAVEDLPASSDYNTVQVRKFVELKALDVFEIISKIFDALRQTNYADEANVGAGWYKCMVAFQDNGEGGVTTTSLEEWYINSRLVGATNRVQAKIVSPDGRDGGEQLILVQVDIEQAPTENDDGTIADLGLWEINASFTTEGVAPTDESFFKATASIGENGLARLTVEDSFEEDFDGGTVQVGTRGVILRSITEGYGLVEVPDWESCFGPDGNCEGGPPAALVRFSYNANYLSIDVNGEESSFDRTDEHEIAHRYKLYNTTDGSDVEKTRTFGFPIRVAEDDDQRFGWYGAWQDRHEIWAHGQSLADGTVVQRNDGGNPNNAPQYTVQRFGGALTRIELVEGSLDQIAGIAAEIFLFNNFRLRWDAETERWFECLGEDGMGGCGSLVDFTDRLPALLTSGEGDQKNVFISSFVFSEGNFVETLYVYSSTPSTGFYVGERNEQTGRVEATEEAVNLAELPDNFELFCSISGRTYIQYTGDFDGPTTTSGWVERTVTSFDFSTYTPTFDAEADREFIFELGRSYFVNNRGANFRVRRNADDGDAGDYQVFTEAQSVAKPTSDLATVYPVDTVLVDSWNPEGSSTYQLNTDPASENYLLLEYASVSGLDEGNGVEVGDVVTGDLWGLRIQGDESDFSTAISYNWTYQMEGEFWGGVSYLVDEDDEYVLVSTPIRLETIQLASTNDIVNSVPEVDWINYSMSFSGHLHGLPDTWWELQKIGSSGDQVPSILSKNVRVPDGTEVTDADSAATYYIKAVDVGIFLGLIDAFPDGEEPDLSLADDLDLDAELPDFDAPDMTSSIPRSAPLLYIQGVPVP